MKDGKETIKDPGRALKFFAGLSTAIASRTPRNVALTLFILRQTVLQGKKGL